MNNLRNLFLILIINFYYLKSANLDNTFSSDGTVTEQIIANNNSQIADIQIQGDGKILATGSTTSSSNSQFAIVRFNSDGSLDANFNNNGIVTTLIGNSSQANAIAIQTDGKIVIVGYSLSNSSYLTIIRYNTDGSIDTSFNSTGSVPGIVTTLIGDGCNAYDVQIDLLGNIIIAGSTITQGQSNFLIARYTSAGILDTSFNDSGIATLQIGSQASATSLAIQNDGKIVIGGFSFNGTTQFAICRYNNDGTIDTQFGNNGIVNTTIGSFALINSLVIDSSGNIVVGGFYRSNSSSNNITVLARYTSLGILDTTFNNSGSIPGIITQEIGNNSVCNSIAIDNSGNIVATGYANITNNKFFVARYTSSGILDTSFATNGILTFSIGTNDQASSLAIQSDGKYIVGGFSDSNFALARIRNNVSSLVSISNPSNATYNQKIIPINGTSTNANSDINIFVDDQFFKKVTSDNSGNWDAGLTNLLSDGSHTIRAEFVNSATSASQVIINIDTSLVRSFAIGNGIRVDQVFGNDSTGVRNGPPFATISGALAKAQSGDTIWVFPGTYNETISNMPQGITLRGVATSQCIIQQTNVTQNTDLITMNENCSLECFKLILTSNSHVQLRGIVFPGTTSVTSRIFECNLAVNNAAAGTIGTSNVYGIHSIGTGVPGAFVQAAVFSFIGVNSAGGGNKRAILIDQPNGFRCFQSVAACNSIGGAGSVIGIETNNASAQFTGVESIIQGFSATPGTYADISQTAGTLRLSGSYLTTMTANGYPFTLIQYPKNFIFADSGAISSVTTYLRPGTATATTNEMQQRVSQAMVVKALSVRLANAPGTGNSVTWTIRKNGIDTGITITISDANTSGLFNTASVNFVAGDLLSISQVPSGANSASDVMAIIDYY